jgi:hypothetical protein
MNTPTFSPNLFLTLFMDMQGGFSFSIPISTVPAHPNFQENVGQVVDKCTIPFFSGYLRKENLGVIKSLSRKQIGRI